MNDRMSQQAYVASCRARAAEIAAAILAGSIPLLDGCHLLDQLGADVAVSDDDPDFSAFSLIQCETEALPLGQARSLWAPDALARLEPEIQAATTWAQSIALPACKSVVARFGA
jgi:hypothetical protein